MREGWSWVLGDGRGLNLSVSVWWRSGWEGAGDGRWQVGTAAEEAGQDSPGHRESVSGGRLSDCHAELDPRGNGHGG